MALLDVCTVTQANVTGSAVRVTGQFNVTATAASFTGIVRLERSLDGGVTYFPVGYPDGAPVQITGSVSVTLTEPNQNALYRFRCTNYTAGTIFCQISQ